MGSRGRVLHPLWAAVLVWTLAVVGVGAAPAVASGATGDGDGLVPQSSSDAVAATLAGTVMAVDGGGVGAAKVTLYERTAGTWEPTSLVASVDESGAWAMTDVPAGEYTLAVVAYTPERALVWWGDRPTLSSADGFVVADGEVRTGLDVAVKPSAPSPGPDMYPVGGGYGPQVGRLLSATVFGWLEDSEFRFQWYADDIAIPGATDRDFRPTTDQFERYLSVEVTAVHPDHATAQRRSEKQWVEAGPLTTALPLIDGDPVVGSTLSVSTPGWTPGTTFTYSWRAGARFPIYYPDTGSSFVVPESALGWTIHVTVTGTRRGYTSKSVTAELVTPIGLATQQIGGITIAGEPKVGSTLTAQTEGWTPQTTFTYEWFSDDGILRGRSRTLSLGSWAVGRNVRLDIGAHEPGHYSERLSRSIDVAFYTLATSQPKITGAIRVNGVVEAEPGTWTKGATLTYRWFVDGKVYRDKYGDVYRGSSIRLPASAYGKTLSVEVSGYKVNYADASRTSAKTRVAAGILPLTRPKITGDVRQGGTVSAVAKTGVTGTRYAYQWYASGRSIPGATDRTYRIRDAQLGKTLTVKVTASATGYAKKSSTSSATLRVPRLPRVSISGTPRVGALLTARLGNTSPGTTYTYQWRDSRGGIVFGDKSTVRRIESGMDGRRIRVIVTARKKGYATVVVSSSYTNVIRR